MNLPCLSHDNSCQSRRKINNGHYIYARVTYRHIVKKDVLSHYLSIIITADAAF